MTELIAHCKGSRHIDGTLTLSLNGVRVKVIPEYLETLLQRYPEQLKPYYPVTPKTRDVQNRKNDDHMAECHSRPSQGTTAHF